MRPLASLYAYRLLQGPLSFSTGWPELGDMGRLVSSVERIARSGLAARAGGAGGGS